MAETIVRLATKEESEGWPTVIAERNGEKVGMISTDTTHDQVMARKLLAKSPFVAIKLVEGYENLLRSLGLVSYRVWTEKDRASFVSSIKRSPGTKIVTETDEMILFERQLNGR